MDSIKERYSIGEIAILTDVSVRTLRFYDQKDLVKPEERDINTGYRYYSKRQLLQILIIKQLKPLGFTLDEIKNALYQNDLHLYRQNLTERRESIVEEIKNLETQLRIANNVSQKILAGINILQTYEKVGNSELRNDYVVKTLTFPQKCVIFTRYLCKYNVANPFFERHAELLKIRDRYNLHSSGPLLAIFHDHFTTQFFSNTCDLEVLLPVISDVNNCPNIKEFGDFFAATTIHVGKYKDLLQAYFALSEWIDVNDYIASDPPIEQYIVDPTDMALEEDFITEIIWPIKKRSSRY